MKLQYITDLLCNKYFNVCCQKYLSQNVFLMHVLIQVSLTHPKIPLSCQLYCAKSMHPLDILHVIIDVITTLLTPIESFNRCE